MVKRLGRAGGCGLSVLGLLLGVTGDLGAQTVTAVPQLDLHRMTGTWYEIVRLPNRREKRCISDAFVLIAPGDKLSQLLMVNSCKTKSGYSNVRNETAKSQDKSGDGRMRVTYLWPFKHKYWVLALGLRDEWALVGSPNHKDLWVYSRATTLAPEVLREVEGRAAAEGFDLAKLLTVPHTALVPSDRGASTAAPTH